MTSTHAIYIAQGLFDLLILWVMVWHVNTHHDMGEDDWYDGQRDPVIGSAGKHRAA